MKSKRAQEQVLVGGFNPSEKYDFVNGVGIIPHIMEKHVPNHQPECVNKHSFSLHEQIVVRRNNICW
jgi:hypothetical protein